ncbi:MAG: hypothetical protein LBP22_16010 [Deltaproteobacteria bacterium]|nr:hypothetical protein [Deltaproteobacteria bacterium]
MVENSGVKIFHDQKEHNFYGRSAEGIHLVPARAFDEPMYYHAAKMHEMGHWTGNIKRLGRHSSDGFCKGGYSQ